MNKLWIAFAIIVFEVGFCVFQVSTVKNITQNVQDQLGVVEEYVENDDIENALQHMKKIDEDWCVNYDLLAVFVPHEQINDITTSIASVKNNLEQSQKEDFFLESVKTKTELKCLRETELIKVQNIL